MLQLCLCASLLRQQVKADGAAAAVQARVRGQLVRQTTQDLRRAIPAGVHSSVAVRAAKIVQAHARGHLARNAMRQLRMYGTPGTGAGVVLRAAEAVQARVKVKA